MRRSTIMTAVILFSCGVLTVSDQANGDDKKEREWPEKPDPKLPERVTYKKWIEQGPPNKREKFFLKPIDNVSASFYKPAKGGPSCRLGGARLVGGTPTPGSEIIEKDGAAWVVTEVSQGGEFFICRIKPKDPPAKD